MRLDEFYKIADEIAPKALSDALCAKYGMYDNSGVLVDVGDVESAVFSLDFSVGAVYEAIKRKSGLIVTHHPAIYGKLSNLCGGESKYGQKDALLRAEKLSGRLRTEYPSFPCTSISIVRTVESTKV